MGDGVTLSIIMGILYSILYFVIFIKNYIIIALIVLIIFSILNYWMRINIKEFLKSYFLIFFIILFVDIMGVYYLTYDIETSMGLVLLDPVEVEKLSPQEYRAHGYFGFLFFTSIGFFTITFFIFLCLLQAYLFKCYSTGEKRKKLSRFIGFVCNIPSLSMGIYAIIITLLDNL